MKYYDGFLDLGVLTKKFYTSELVIFLETFIKSLGISDTALDHIRSKISSSKCYLNASKKVPNTMLDKKWNVCVPYYISSILSKGSSMNEL